MVMIIDKMKVSRSVCGPISYISVFLAGLGLAWFYTPPRFGGQEANLEVLFVVGSVVFTWIANRFGPTFLLSVQSGIGFYLPRDKPFNKAEYLDFKVDTRLSIEPYEGSKRYVTVSFIKARKRCALGIYRLSDPKVARLREAITPHHFGDISE